MHSNDVTEVIGDAPSKESVTDEGATPSASDPPPPTPPRSPSVGQLRRERKRLWEDRQEATFHIGGLALELHNRDMLDDPLLVRRVEHLRSLDARIGQIDEELVDLDARRRRSRTRTPEPTGYCMSCGAPRLADAVFCSQCGARVRPAVVASDDTQVIDVDAT